MVEVSLKHSFNLLNHFKVVERFQFPCLLCFRGKKKIENEVAVILRQFQPCCTLYSVVLGVRSHQVYFTKYSIAFATKNLNLKKNIE